MANNYTQSTIQPSLPKAAFTPLELEMLSYCGFSYEPDENETLYFYCEEGDSALDTAFWEIYDNFQNDPSYKKYSVIEGDLYAPDIFQDILNKPECTEIPYITIEGAHTCDKMRPGEFGGFATLITRDDIKSTGTNLWLSEVTRNLESVS